MDKLCGIYCIENTVNGKKYVGQSVDINNRFRNHKASLRKNKHNNVHLQSAWNIYKEYSFIFYVIEECPKDMLNEREMYYIASMNLTNQEYGYNIDPGGDSNNYRHAETRLNMVKNHADVSGENNPMYGKHHSDETKQKIIQNRNTVRGKDHPNYGKPLSDKTKQKLSESHKGVHAGNKHPRCRPVYCPELNQSFWGAAEAEQEYGIDRTYIYACLSGRQKSAGKHPITGEALHWQAICEN